MGLRVFLFLSLELLRLLKPASLIQNYSLTKVFTFIVTEKQTLNDSMPSLCLQENVCIYYSNSIHVCVSPGKRQVGRRVSEQPGEALLSGGQRCDRRERGCFYA